MRAPEKVCERQEFNRSPVIIHKFPEPRPTWIQAAEHGQIIAHTEWGDRETFQVEAGQVITGKFSALVSFNCRGVVVGGGKPPESVPPEETVQPKVQRRSKDEPPPSAA